MPLAHPTEKYAPSNRKGCEVTTRTIIHDRVDAAGEGLNRTVIARMASGWAVIGDTQFLPGYCLLLADPVVPSINDLDAASRGRFLQDMVSIGDAILRVTDAYRINYEILGNSEPALHAHIWARYRTEDADLVKGPAWLYPPEVRGGTPFDEARHRPFMKQVFEELNRLGAALDPGPALQTEN